MAFPPPPPYTLRTLSEEDTASSAGQPEHTDTSDIQHHRLSAGYTYNTRRSSQSPRGMTHGSPSHKRGRHPQLSSSPDEISPFSKPDSFTSHAPEQLGTSPTPGPSERRQSVSVMSDGSYDDSLNTPKHSRRLPPIFPLAGSAPASAAADPAVHPNSANTTRNRRVSFAAELSGPQNFIIRPALNDRAAASNRNVESTRVPDNGVPTKKISIELL